MTEYTGSERYIGVAPVPRAGDYGRELDKSVFLGSKVSAKSGEYVSMLQNIGSSLISGNLRGGVEETIQKLNKLKVRLAKVATPSSGIGTDILDGMETLLLDVNFDSQHPSLQLWSLQHRIMSLILKRSGMRDDPAYIRELLRMDLAYTSSLRATQWPSGEDEKVMETVSLIEQQTKLKLEGLAAEQKK